MRERFDRAVARAGSSGEVVARGRGTRWPWLTAVFGAGVLAFVVALHPVLAGVALEVGAFVLLLAQFFAISTVLHARQRRGRACIARH